MTLRERHQRNVALKLRVRSARERMTRAMEAMDYAAALTHQIEIDELERQVHLRERQQNLDLTTLPMRPQRLPFMGVWRL